MATFNASLFRNQPGELIRELESGRSGQGRRIAEVIQIVRPDILLINEFDFDANGKAIAAFKRHYLEKSQGGRKGMQYRFQFVPQVNTGVPSGHDLNHDGKQHGPGDAFGFGNYPGQYGFVVLATVPIDLKRTRTFQRFLWKDMPRALIPRNQDGTGYYSPEELRGFRLSSKNHCDVVCRVSGKDFHFLVSHPTPPVFDGEEDRNGRRNHDEIRFWSDYVIPANSAYIYDDQQRKGGLANGARFVIAGDLNADPNDGQSTASPIRWLAQNHKINFAIEPRSKGAVEASRVGVANGKQNGDPAVDTADFEDSSVGNLRVDYVLPSANLEVIAAGVFWPEKADVQSKLIEVSDHRLVWIDLLDWESEDRKK
ncbi:MAG: endonuclease/exonuclease/phosphatase family protein [Planctomycetota bacterium]|nr:endonuclease/exonuclease/phosphatase family protein [Planctomycetota bacterium]